jgi:type I restriction enzyme S subunit
MSTRSPQNLNDACEFIVDCLHATAPTQADGCPLIRTPNIGKGRLDFTDVYRVSEETYQTWTRRAVPEPGDLILAREAPAGNVAIVKEGEKVCLGQRTVHLRPNGAKVDPDFLCYFLLAPRQQGKLLAGETGATAKHVNMKDIRRLELAGLPNLPTQRAAGSLLAAYDDLIENNRRRMALLKDAARQLYREWFVRLRFPGHEHTPVTNGLPERWERVPLGDRVTLNYGKALKAEDRADGSCPVYGSSGIVGMHEKALARAPGIVIGRKGNVGSVYWCPKDYWPIDTAYFIDAQTSNLWLYYAIQQMHFISTDVAVPGLNRNFAYSRQLLVPEPRIVRDFLDTAVPLHEQIAKLDEMNDKLRAARDLLLPRLMSAEIPI